MGAVLIYFIVGLLVYGSFKTGSPSWKTGYALLFPLHVLVLGQLEEVFDFVAGVRSTTWHNVLIVLGIILFVFLMVR